MKSITETTVEFVSVFLYVHDSYKRKHPFIKMGHLGDEADVLFALYQDKFLK